MFRQAALVLVACAMLMSCAGVYKAPRAIPAPRAESDAGRVVIRSGSLDLRVKDLEHLKTQVEELVSDVSGRISDWSMRDGSVPISVEKQKWRNLRVA